MWFAIDRHSGPSVGDNFDVGGCNVRVGFDEVCSEDTGEELGRRDWVLLCLNIDSVLHRVSS